MENKNSLSSAVLKPSTPGEWAAYLISQLCSPPVMALTAVVLTAVTLALPRIWMWVGVYLILGMVIPLGYVVWLVRRGKVTDLDLQLREQRNGPFIVTIAGVSAAWLVMRLGGAPEAFTLMAGASVIQSLLIYLITLRWKISVHTSTAAGMTVLLWSVAGRTAVPLALTLPFIAWSRVKLRRHTPLQTLAGTALGSSIFLIAVLIGA